MTHTHVTNHVFHCTPRCSSFQINSTLPIFSPFWTTKNLLRCFRSKFAPQLAHHLFLRPFTHQRPTRCIQREAVAIRTKLRHRDPSLTSNWRDDAEQRVRASKHNVLHNAQLFCLILRHLPKCFVYSVESSFRGLYFNPEMKMPLCSSQSPLFKA